MTDSVIFANAFPEPIWVQVEKNGQKVMTFIPAGQSESVYCELNKSIYSTIFIQYGDLHRGSIMLTKLYGPLDLGPCSNVVVDKNGVVDRSNKDNAWIDTKGVNHKPQ